MPITRSKYEADNDSIHPIRLDSTTLAAAGTPPAGAVDDNVPAKISKGNREFGLRPRGVRLSRELGVAPNTFKRYKFLPVLTKTAFDTATFAIDADITVDGNTWKVVSKVAEDYS